MLNFQAQSQMRPYWSEIFEESHGFAQHAMRSSMGSQGFGPYGSHKLPGSCNRGIISILWQPMRSFVTSGGQSWIASAWALRTSSCNESTIWEYVKLSILIKPCVCSIFRHRLNGARTSPKFSKTRTGSHSMPCDHPWVLRGLTLTGPVNYPEFYVTGA